MEGELLYSLAGRCTGSGIIVEVGSYKGKSTVWLAAGAKAGKGPKVYAVDTFAGPLGRSPSTFEAFMANVRSAHVEDIICPVVKSSEVAAKEMDLPLELLFIDGDHSYSAVSRDYFSWSPKVLPGGFIAFHDVDESYVEVERFVSNVVLRGEKLAHPKQVRSIVYVKRVQQVKVHQALENWLFSYYLLYRRNALGRLILKARGMFVLIKKTLSRSRWVPSS